MRFEGQICKSIIYSYTGRSISTPGQTLIKVTVSENEAQSLREPPATKGQVYRSSGFLLRCLLIFHTQFLLVHLFFTNFSYLTIISCLLSFSIIHLLAQKQACRSVTRLPRSASHHVQIKVYHGYLGHASRGCGGGTVISSIQHSG
jgi:hypothetical protein